MRVYGLVTRCARMPASLPDTAIHRGLNVREVRAAPSGAAGSYTASRWRETVPACQHASRSDAPPEFYSRGREPTARSHKTPDWPDPSQEQGAARLTEPRNYQDFNDRVFVSCPYKW